MVKTTFFRLAHRRLPGLAFVVLIALAGGCAKQTTPQAEREAEAKRLYERADLMVRQINEGEYTYDYINFHYLQAVKNIDRIALAYGDTDYGQKLKRGELKLGTYEIEHFRGALINQLGDMKEATESITNCATYLYNLPEANRTESLGALALILETLCRQVRSDEAMIFPTLPQDRLFAKVTIVRVVSRYLQQGIALALLQSANEEERPFVAAAYGEGIAVGGTKLAALNEFAARYATPEKRVEAGILRGMIERENNVYRDQFDKVKQERERQALAALKDSGKEPAQPKEAPVRYEVATYYREKFGANPPAEAVVAYAGFLALRDKFDEARALVRSLDESALVSVIGNYYDFLALKGQLSGRENLHRTVGLSPDGVAGATCKLIEYLAQNAHYTEADAIKTAATAEFPKFRDHFIRYRMKGQFYSREELFYLNAKTVPSLGIKDPAICAEVLLDWFLSPNRLLKGSSWGADQIVFNYFSMQKEGRPTSRKQKLKGS